MAYNFQDRLQANPKRFKEINGETVTYARPWAPINSKQITGSPILRTAEEVIPEVTVTRIEKQQWAFDTSDLVEFDFPLHGDIITRSNGDVFKVVSDSNEGPAYRFTTSKRDRLIVETIRVSIGPDSESSSSSDSGSDSGSDSSSSEAQSPPPMGGI